QDNAFTVRRKTLSEGAAYPHAVTHLEGMHQLRERTNRHDGELQGVVPGNAERFFGITRYPDHGKLSGDAGHGPVEGIRAGARVILLDAADGVGLVQRTGLEWGY